MREGLPLRRDRWDEYLDWAVDCFRLSTAAVRDETQIHTHMCYSEFGDIMRADPGDGRRRAADRGRALDAWSCSTTGSAPATSNEIGPGVYDIHSPRVPLDRGDGRAAAARGAACCEPEQLWVNPDCGLKTRATRRSSRRCATWSQAAKQLREELVPAAE